MKNDLIAADTKIYVAGHTGLVGSAICRAFKKDGHTNILTIEHSRLDLTNQAATEKFLASEKPKIIVISAARVGGIFANSQKPAEFAYENLMIASNLIHAAWQNKVSRLLFLGSSCIYPKESDNPITEEQLLTGPLEPSNEGYAIAKIAGLKLCQYYRKQYGCLFHSAMPCNLYGPGDNFDLDASHVIPGLLNRFAEAKRNNHENIVIWGSGKPKREFLYSDDLANAIVTLISEPNPPDLVNIGAGTEVSISDLANKIAALVEYKGEISFDHSKPDGTMRKLMNSSKMRAMGWRPSVDLEEGLHNAYEDFKSRP